MADARERIEALVQDRTGDWLTFSDPALVIVAENADAVRPALAEVERRNRDSRLHAVGYVTYEAGAAFGLPVSRQPGNLPMVWFGLFEPSHVGHGDAPASAATYEMGQVSPSLTRAEFDRAFVRIREFIAAGDTYQVNFTFRMHGLFDGDARAFFADLVEAQRGAHSAFIRIGPQVICSASPELFFELDGLAVRSRPMKGTVRRGRTLAEDRQQRENLRMSAKQQAENVMIVDMVRNDLGRVAEVGSVHVPELYTAEKYPNVWQMTSLVTARSTASLEELFAAMHPPASVTGAPKLRTMEILSNLERVPRGVYTGAIGHVPPDGNGSFNVAIRTAVIDERAHTIDFGVGSGIVWDSESGPEYDECLLKGAVIRRRPERFELLETLRWTPDAGFFLLDRHLNRLRDSAEYFGFVCDGDAVRSALGVRVRGSSGPLRVRLLVSRDGGTRVEGDALVGWEGPLRVAFAAGPIDANDVALFHKTTNRQIYDRARAEVPHVDEVILWNEAGEVTEATTANIVAEIDGDRVTPPIECGLLGGTYRAEMLAQGAVREKVITVDQLRAAPKLWLINSVYGEREAVLTS